MQIKNILTFLVICFYATSSFGQKTTKESYVTYDPKHIIQIEDLVYEETTITSKDGIMIMKSGGEQLEAAVDEFSIISINKNTFQDSILSKTYLKDRSVIRASIMGERIDKIDSSVIENTTLKFKKIAENNWEIIDFDTLTAIEQSYAEDEKLGLNTELKDGRFDFIYPEKMAIGDSLVLNKDTVKTFYNTEQLNLISGSLLLKEVITKDDERTAIFDVKLNFEGIVDKEDDAKLTLKMEGILERSLEKFYDKRMNLQGSFRMEGNISEDEYLIIEGPATLNIAVKLN